MLTGKLPLKKQARRIFLIQVYRGTVLTIGGETCLFSQDQKLLRDFAQQLGQPGLRCYLSRIHQLIAKREKEFVQPLHSPFKLGNTASKNSNRRLLPHSIRPLGKPSLRSPALATWLVSHPFTGWGRYQTHIMRCFVFCVQPWSASLSRRHTTTCSCPLFAIYLQGTSLHPPVVEIPYHLTFSPCMKWRKSSVARDSWLLPPIWPNHVRAIRNEVEI